MPRFTSVTGRAALSARGGHAAARYHASTGWLHQRTISYLGNIARTRKRLIRSIPMIDCDCRRVFNCTLAEYLAHPELYDAQITHKPKPASPNT